ncbi:MAG TPA: hypothetical protein EYG21_02975 [Nitrospinaceae bacterium]|nr:hypothetical protein [Micavibrio sp.]HIL26345.1 hypothetical protein [Nitrospinaceae bacterium]
MKIDLASKSLTVKNNPGAVTWKVRDDGDFDCSYGALGASGKKIDNPREVAKAIYGRAESNKLEEALKALGWDKVLEEIYKIQSR